MKAYSISAFFPAYNEATNLPKLVDTADKTLKEIANKYEIIIVDDGSEDNTFSVVEELKKKYPAIKIVRHEKNLGYGAAIKTGFKSAQYELIFFSDADNQFSISELPLLVFGIENVDMVTGYRHKRKDPFMRRFNAWGWNLLVRMLLGLKVADIDCAFKLFKRESFLKLGYLESKGALINTEIFARMKAKNMKIKEFPVTHYVRSSGVQTGAKLRVIIKAFVELHKLYKELHYELKNARDELTWDWKQELK